MLRSIRRTLAEQFDRVHTAHGCEEAEVFLQQEPPVTHLICDLWLGGGMTRGDVLIGQWREKYPSIEKAALMTGDAVSRDDCECAGVDTFFEKPLDPDYIRAFFAK